MFTSELGNDPASRCVIVMIGFPSFLLIKLAKLLAPPVFSNFIIKSSAGLKSMPCVSVDVCQMDGREQNWPVKF